MYLYPTNTRPDIIQSHLLICATHSLITTIYIKHQCWEHKNKCHCLRHPVTLFQRLPARFPHTSANASTFSQASFLASLLLFWSGKRKKINMNNIKITKQTKLTYSAYCSTEVRPGRHTPCMRRLNTFHMRCLGAIPGIQLRYRQIKKRGH